MLWNMDVPHGRLVPRHGWALLMATGLSGLGNAIVAVVLPWLVLQRTGSPALAGLIAAAALAPLVISAVLGGAFVDRWGRRTTSVRADLLSAVAVAAVPIVDLVWGLTIPALVVLVAAGAMFDGPGMAAREALRPDVAHTSGWGLERVNARGEAVDGLAAVVGPAAAGLLIVILAPVAALWVTAVMFVLAAAVTRWLVPDTSAAPRHDDPANFTAGTQGRTVTGTTATMQAKDPYWVSVRVGLSLVWRDRTLRAVGLLGAVVVLVLAPAEAVVLPAWFAAADDASGLAAVLVAFAAGGLVGSLSGPALTRRWGRRRVLLMGLVALTVGVSLFAVVEVTGGLVTLAVVTGLGAGPVGPLLAVLAQERTPEPLRGRVLGAMASMSLAAAPAGLLVTGPLLQATGFRTTYLVLGGLCLAAVCFAYLSRGLRREMTKAPNQASAPARSPAPASTQPSTRETHR